MEWIDETIFTTCSLVISPEIYLIKWLMNFLVLFQKMSKNWKMKRNETLQLAIITIACSNSEQQKDTLECGTVFQFLVNEWIFCIVLVKVKSLSLHFALCLSEFFFLSHRQRCCSFSRILVLVGEGNWKQCYTNRSRCCG